MNGRSAEFYPVPVIPLTNCHASGAIEEESATSELVNGPDTRNSHADVDNAVCSGVISKCSSCAVAVDGEGALGRNSDNER